MSGIINMGASGFGIAQANNNSTAIVNVFHNSDANEQSEDNIRSAYELISSIPTLSVPSTVELPKIHYMPWMRNKNFVGRDDELKKIACLIKDGVSSSSETYIALTGIGGQGKTQLAVEFSYRYGKWFPGGIFFVNCSEPQSIPLSIAGCGLSLNLSKGFSALPLPEQIALVGSAWASSMPRLLVFDNCEDERILEDWLPKRGGCRLILTSRRPTWDTCLEVHTIITKPLERNDSIKLIIKHRPDIKDNDIYADDISKELNDLPLALELAGRYLKRYKHDLNGSLQNYLIDLKSKGLLNHNSLKEKNNLCIVTNSSTRQETGVARTFELSFQKLSVSNLEDRMAVEIFWTLSWLAPNETVSREFLIDCLEINHLDLDKIRLFSDGLSRLLALALVEESDKENGNLSMHSLLSEFGRMHEKQIPSLREKTDLRVGAITNAILFDNRPYLVRIFASHLHYIAMRSDNDNLNYSIQLLKHVGTYNLLIANYGLSEYALDKSLKRCNDLLGIDHPYSSSILSVLGKLYNELARYHEAEAAEQKSINIRKDNPPVIDVELAHNLMGLSVAKSNLEDLGAAEQLLKEAITLYEKSLGPYSNFLAGALSNLGPLQLSQGHKELAYESVARAISIYDYIKSDDEINIAYAHINLGGIQGTIGDLDGARESFIKAIDILSRTIGTDHPFTARAMGNLAYVKSQTNDTLGAAQDYCIIIKTLDARWGRKHPATLLVLGNAASFLSEFLNTINLSPDIFESLLELAEVISGGPET